MKETTTREKILNTALELFSTRGYFTTSVHDIRKEAGVSVGSIYHHFKTKEDIAKALFTDLTDWLQNALHEAIDQHQTLADRCRAITHRLFAMTDENPTVMHFIFYARHKEFLPDEPPLCSSQPFDTLRTLATQGMENGEIRTVDPTLAVSMLFGGALRMIQLKLDGVIQENLTDSVDHVWNCAWNGMKS